MKRDENGVANYSAFHSAHLGRKSQRVQSLVEVNRKRADVDKHKCLRIAPERVLQEVGELRVAVRDVLILVGKRSNNVPQATQALVDGLRLL